MVLQRQSTSEEDADAIATTTKTKMSMNGGIERVFRKKGSRRDIHTASPALESGISYT